MTAATDKLNWGRVLPIFALTFVDVLGLTIILPLLHLYALTFGATPLEVGLAMAAFPLAQLIGVPVMGALSDRFGRKPLLLISQITTCISFILLAGAESLAMVVFSRVLDGLFGANLATAQAAISDVTTERNRAQGLGLTGAAFGLGFLFGPAISLAALEFTDSLAVPALIAAAYSFASILLTLFLFKETLPPERRQAVVARSPLPDPAVLRNPQIRVLLGLMFVQQLVFFGFEAMLGTFLLTRLGLLGQGSALVFILVGLILVAVQGRYLGRWTRRYGERSVLLAALALLGVGLILLSLTPQQAHPFYVRQKVENTLVTLRPGSAESVIGAINVTLPADSSRGFGGLLWLLVSITPLAVGAGLMRPSLNSLMTRRAGKTAYGRVLGWSGAAVSAADAAAPLLAGLIFQQYGATVLFLGGGLWLAAVFFAALMTVKPAPVPAEI